MKHIHTDSATQNGFSIVEIMTAMALSLFLVAGVVQMYLSSKESYRLQSELGRMQENQRLAIELLQRDIRNAGFFINDDPANPNISAIAKFDVAVGGDGFVNTRDGGGNNSDVITVRYEATTDCLGNDLMIVDGGGNRVFAAADGNVYAVNKYFIQNEQLMCLGNGNANPEVLVSGVTNMQILYGEDTDAQALGVIPTANRYVQAQQANLNRVVSVRIALLFSSINPVKPQAINQIYSILDAPDIDITDKRRHQTIITTIPLRNNT